jgi:hypothetical protein
MSTLTILTIWTLALALVIVLVVAVYLIAVAYYLYKAGGSSRSNLAQLVGGLKAVRDNVAPLDAHVTALGGGLTALRGELLAVDSSLADAGQILGA